MWELMRHGFMTLIGHFWKHINISHKLYLNAFSFDKLSLQFYISAKLEYSTLVTYLYYKRLIKHLSTYNILLAVIKCI